MGHGCRFVQKELGLQLLQSRFLVRRKFVGNIGCQGQRFGRGLKAKEIAARRFADDHIEPIDPAAGNQQQRHRAAKRAMKECGPDQKRFAA